LGPSIENYFEKLDDLLLIPRPVGAKSVILFQVKIEILTSGFKLYVSLGRRIGHENQSPFSKIF